MLARNPASTRYHPMAQADPPILGQSAGPIPFSTRREARDLAAGLARQARHDLAVYSHDLDPALYDQRPFLDALAALARGHRCSVRILCRDARRAVVEGHRLVELARRFTSCLQVRRVPDHLQDTPEAWLVADARGWLYRPEAGRFEGVADFDAPHRARELLDLFQEVWEHSEPEPELRRLYL